MAEPLFQQLQNLQQAFSGHPPVDQWNPDLCGDMDLVIRADGRWIHQGTEIKRKPLVQLFASIMKRVGDDFFLLTPVEKWRIQVEDAPFIATQVARTGEEASRHILFTTNTADIVPLDPNHPLLLKPFGEPAQPIPYIEVRGGLEARLSRSVYYQLIDWAEPGVTAVPPAQLWLQSGSQRFLLGEF